MKCSVEQMGKPEGIDGYKWLKNYHDSNNIILNGLFEDQLMIQVWAVQNMCDRNKNSGKCPLWLYPYAMFNI